MNAPAVKSLGQTRWFTAYSVPYAMVSYAMVPYAMVPYAMVPYAMVPYTMVLSWGH